MDLRIPIGASYTFIGTLTLKRIKRGPSFACYFLLQYIFFLKAYANEKTTNGPQPSFVAPRNSYSRLMHRQILYLG